MRLRFTLLGTVALLGIALSAAALAAPARDPSFGDNGVVLRGFVGEPGSGWITDVALDSGGATFAAGFAGRGGWVVARYRRDGALDPDWGVSGFAFEDRMSTGTIARQGSKLLVGGAFVPDPESLDYWLAVGRRNEDGSVDRSFGGGDGMVVTNVTDMSDAVQGLAVDSAGRIVAVAPLPSLDDGYAVARYTPDGRIDRSFGGGDGIVIIEVPGDVLCCTTPVPVEADGLITIGGVWGGDPAIFRLTDNGSFVGNFGGGDGIATIPLPDGPVIDLDIAADGRIVTALGYAMRAARFLPDGTPDPAFGDGGVSEPFQPLSISTGSKAIRALPDGGALVGGTAYPQGSAQPRDFALLRLLPDGSPDPAFGDGGLVVTDVAANSHDDGNALDVASNGRAVLGGEAVPSPYFRVFGLVSYTPEGELDPGFGGGDGIVFGPPLLPGEDKFSDLLTDDRRRLVAAGATGGRFTVARFSPGGNPDSSFGENGLFRLPRDPASPGRDWASAVAVREGVIIAAGKAGGKAVVTRHTGGDLDESFGDEGVFSTEALAAATDVLALADGGVIVAGFKGSNEGMIRLDESGEVVGAFGDGGVVMGPVTPGARRPPVYLFRRPAGGFLLARGSHLTAYGYDGQPIDSFGEEGVVTIRRFGPFGTIAAAVPAAAGKTILAGAVEGQAAVLRLNRDGSLDRSFARNGFLRRRVARTSRATGLRRTGRGGLIVSGISSTCRYPWCRQRRGFLAAFGPRGAPWRAFGERSLVTVGTGTDSGLLAIVRQRRRIVAAGWATLPRRREEALLTRYRLTPRR